MNVLKPSPALGNCRLRTRHAIDDRRHNPRVRVPVLDVAEAMETNVAAGCIQQSQTEYRDPTLTPLMLGRDAT